MADCKSTTAMAESYHPVQEIMSRTGSFPLRVPYQIMAEFAPKGAVVLDPFCGKGTTLLAARLRGYPAYGLDVAPEAVVCSLAKLQHVSVETVLDYVEALPAEGMKDEEAPEDVRVFFHPDTLGELMSVRTALLRAMKGRDQVERAVATVALAALLGILHGHASYSLSISAAHAFSMSPRYVMRYAETHGLEPPRRDVRRCLTAKLTRCLAMPLPPKVPGAVRRACASDAARVFPELRGKVDLVITSPPYLATQTYCKDNWLRLWLLGYDHRSLRGEYIETSSTTLYAEFIARAFTSIAELMKPGARLICIAGDARRRRMRGGKLCTEVVRTGDIIARQCCTEECGMLLEAHRVQDVPSRQRYFHALTQADGHEARDLVERVIVARKV